MFNQLKKIKNWLLGIFFILFIIFLFTFGKTYNKSDLVYGVTFSKKEAIDLSLNWQQVFIATLDDLKVRQLRLVAYWDEIQKADGVFDWQDVDWQIKEASARQASIVLAVGGRLPRWPECHLPSWTKGLSKTDRETKELEYIKQTIERYKNEPQIAAWQVENEPFLSQFGECPETDAKFLDQEIALVKQLDNRPIVVTDSGELSIWYPAASRADIFGTTMYRYTYSSLFSSYIHYPITSAFFKFKRNLVGLFCSPKDWWVIELQAEPWAPVPFQETSQAERDKTMDLIKFKETIEFARQAGFKKFYLWGVEWWYWERQNHSRPEFWDTARGLF